MQSLNPFPVLVQTVKSRVTMAEAWKRSMRTVELTVPQETWERYL